MIDALIDYKFETYAELSMELPCGRPPQRTFPCVDKKYYTVGDIALQFESDSPAIYKSIFVAD